MSAKTPAAFARSTALLADFLAGTDHALSEVAFVLNHGRDDHRYRAAFAVHGTGELVDRLRGAVPPDRQVPEDRPVVLLFSGDAEIDDDHWAALCAEAPALDPAVTGTTMRQHALHRLLAGLGLTATRLVGSGAGNVVVRLARGRITEAEAARLAAETPRTGEVDGQGLKTALSGFVAEGAVVVEMSATGALSRRIAELEPDLPVVRLSGGVLDAVVRLYELGVAIDWDTHYEDSSIARVELPTYPFEPVPCWSGPQPGAEADGSPEVERAVAGIWERLLKTEVDADTDYVASGGTSIAGIVLLREVEAAFGVTLTFGDLYEHRTVARLAAVIASRRTDDVPAVQPVGDWAIGTVPRDGGVPLSVGQEQLWYLDRLHPGSPLYNIPADLRLRGRLDRAALRAAFADLVERHEVLRSRVVADSDGVPRALLDAARPELVVVDAREGLDDLVAAEAAAPFDLARGPLLRAKLFDLADDDHLLLCTWHHIVFDGWTPGIFLRDLAELYTARVTGRPPRLPELPVQYADYAAWQRSRLTPRRRERGLAYWRSRLDGARVPELPIDKPRPPVESHAGDLLGFTVPQGQADALRELSRQEGVTTFVTMMAVLDAVLHLWAGQEDVVVGAATTGRVNPATHDLIGYFNNMLPFRTRLDGAMTFRELLRRCADTVAGALDHEEIPFADIVADLRPRRDPARHPLFTVAYTHQNTTTHAMDLPGLDVDPPEDGGYGIVPGTAKFDLTVGVADQDGGPMRGYLEYATDLFEPATARRVVDLFRHVAATATADPDRRLARFAAEPEDVWTAVRRHAQARPDAVAVADGEVRTWSEVVEEARVTAERLRAEGVGPGSVVPVVAARGAGLVVAWLGVLAAGAAFAPVDPAAPPERTELVLEELDAPVMLVDGAVRRGGGSGRVVPDTAYVAFTSGSTGRPQGCEIHRAALLNLLTWYGERLNLTEADRVGQSFAAGFDGAVAEILGALHHGATLRFLPDVRSTPQTLLRLLADEGITVLALPTPVAELLLDGYVAVPGLALRVLWTGGDRLRVRPPADLPFTVFNCYGPTECAVITTAGPVAPSGDGPPDIGRPITGATAHVLDAAGAPVADGEPGELYLGGVPVGRGYHRQPGRTAARFVADPSTTGGRMYRTGDLVVRRPDGTLEFRGRADDQIALRGHRVEPAEVEQALLACPGVAEALVVAEDLPSGARRLVAHVAGEHLPTEGELRAALARRLPEPLVPARVVAHATLPRTPHGKLDRKVVASTPHGGFDQRAVTGTPQDVLAGIWADLLGRRDIGPDDDFFQVGGDSILSVGVAARAARAGLAITPHDVVRHPTLRQLAAAVSPASPPPAPAPQGGGIPLSPLMHRVLEARGNRARGFVVAEVLAVAPGIPAEAVAEAQGGAVADARRRAEGYARALGARLGPLRLLADGDAETQWAVESRAAVAGYGGSPGVPPQVDQLSLEAQRITVTVRCTATWALLD
ncbi:SIMPL domain-containing protein [Saccharothrix sp. MB29]|nr:SIMPL domain-containing protein [Saccharothrix sp. MB29]